MAKRDYFWVARDAAWEHTFDRETGKKTKVAVPAAECEYYIFTKKPKLDPERGTYGVGSSLLDCLGARDFKRVTGFSLKPGECCKVKLVRVD
jgi:hypothetical protein